MTTERDSKGNPNQAESPKLEKEALKDLEPVAEADSVKGGAAGRTGQCVSKTGGCY